MSKCKCNRFYCFYCKDRCYDDKTENNFYEQKNEEDRQVLIDIATAFSNRYPKFVTALKNNEDFGGSCSIKDIVAVDEGLYISDDDVEVEIYWNDFNIIDIDILNKADVIKIFPKVFFQVPFHLYVNGTYLTELKKHIAEKTGCNNIEIDFSNIETGVHWLSALEVCLSDKYEFSGSFEPMIVEGNDME